MKYVCTVRPSIADEKMIKKLYENGMSTVRFNMSYEPTTKLVNDLVPIIKQINKQNNYNIKTMVDLRGLEIRISIEKSINITKNDIIVFGQDVKIKDGNLSSLNVGDVIIIGDGELQFSVENIQNDLYTCKALNTGILNRNKKITNEKLCKTLPFLSEKDIQDIKQACELNVDYLCVSFVNNIENINAIRKIIDEKKSPIKIIAKIETVEGVNNLKEIIKVVDGVMIGRGDLGVRFPIYELAKQQKYISKIVKESQKKLIVGTGFLSAMETENLPTRAEVNDLYNTALDGADEIMFSGETAAEDPVYVLEIANKIVNSIN